MIQNEKEICSKRYSNIFFKANSLTERLREWFYPFKKCRQNRKGQINYADRRAGLGFLPLSVQLFGFLQQSSIEGSDGMPKLGAISNTKISLKVIRR